MLTELPEHLKVATQPVHIGPTWEEDPKWDGKSLANRYVLPEITLGWQVLDWIEKNLNSDEIDMATGKPIPFKPTREQARFILWLYAIDERGVFLYQSVILQRLKGWGKDPLAAVLSAVEFVGPCRFAGWATRDMPEKGLFQGDPVGMEHPRAWVQVAAVSREQTKNTMTIFNGLFSAQCIAEHGIDVNKEIIYAHNGQRRIEAVTSSPKTLEGGRPTFVIKNETHHWLANNDGHAMQRVIEDNATKSKDGAARTFSITNAFNPGEDSIAQREREAWEQVQEGYQADAGVFYDSLEAPKAAKLRPPKQHRDDPDPTEEEIRLYLAAIIESIRGDSTWLNVERIVNRILNGTSDPDMSRRFWFNQIVGDEDAWADPEAVDLAVDDLARAERSLGGDVLRAGWIVRPNEEIVVFLDCSKSDDSTAMIGCVVETGYCFTLGIWQRPPRLPKEQDWVAPRWEVSKRIDEVMERFTVVAFWADPSHAKDDDPEAGRYWDMVLDEAHRKYKDTLKVWSVKTGNQEHSVMWDMTSPERISQFVAAAERVKEELHTLNDVEEYEPAFKHDGHPSLVQHLKNAHSATGRYGESLMKPGRSSTKKIDLAVALIGARMLRRVVLNTKKTDQRRAGVLWGI